MIVVGAGAGHAALLAAIHASAFVPEEAWSAHALASSMGLPGSFALLSPPDRGFVLARVAADEAEILTLAVAPPARRCGIARRLLQEAMETAGRNGAARMFLDVSERNAAARALYDRAGFQAAGRRRSYYADGADALLLARPLAPVPRP